MAWRGNELTNGTYTVLANRQKDTFVHGFLDVSGRVLIAGNLVLGSGGRVGIGTANPSVALDVVGNVRCTAGVDLNYTTVPTYASNQIGYNGTFTVATPSVNTKGSVSGLRYAYAFKSAHYFPVGIYLFLMNFYCYDGNTYLNLNMFLTTTNSGTSNSIDTIISANAPASPINGSTIQTPTQITNAHTFTDIITIQTAGTYYAGFAFTPVLNAVTVNIGGFFGRFVRIA